MKRRNGFVTNSSSTLYIIENISDSPKTLVDFVEETKYLIDEYNKSFGPDPDDIDTVNPPEEPEPESKNDITIENVRRVAKDIPMKFEPHKQELVSMGDHDGPWGNTPLGQLYDYELRDGGKTKSFRWRFKEWQR